MIKCRKAVESLTPYLPGKPIEEVRREYGILEVTKLASNESQWGASPLALLAAREAVLESAVYPDGNCTELKDALSKKLGVPSEKILLGCGSDETIHLLGKTYINEGDECITGDVTFSTYAAAVDSMGGRTVYVPLRNHTFDLDGILAAITPRTKLIFIANPNNPTGTAITHKEQEEFIKKVPEDVLIFFDEAYQEFVKTPSFPNTIEFLPKYRNVILSKTFSKIYGLAAFRVGYMIADPEIIDCVNRIRPPFNVNSVAQKAAVAALSDDEFVQKVARENRGALGYLQSELDKMGISYIPSETNFLMIDVAKNAQEVFVELMKEGYIVRSGAPFGEETYIRVTTGTLAQMSGFIEKLKKVLGK
ncbi:histidinol-phosphate aminotransferase [Clostridia bacterium]|nr:histidinol-phosphate aminotransferase [Clostridia bacterium]